MNAPRKLRITENSAVKKTDRKQTCLTIVTMLNGFLMGSARIHRILISLPDIVSPCKRIAMYMLRMMLSVFLHNPSEEIFIHYININNIDIMNEY